MLRVAEGWDSNPVSPCRICNLQIPSWLGAEQERLQPLNGTSVETRRFYFVRRTLATLTEIEGALHKLNSNKEFDRIKSGMHPDSLKAWNKAITFFAKEHAFLKNWRNDIGGHFLDAAATYAIDAVRPSTAGTIEVYRLEKGADVRMPFAYELLAVAMTRNKCGHGTAVSREVVVRWVQPGT
jgi:hypothetical protein